MKNNQRFLQITQIETMNPKITVLPHEYKGLSKLSVAQHNRIYDE